MSSYPHNLFCDETDTDGKPFFYIGGVACPPVTTDRIDTTIEALKSEFQITGRVKWSKVGNNPRFIEFYKKLIDIFFDEKYVYLHIMRFEKTSGWKTWSKNERERFFKCYYIFFQHNLSLFRKYDVYLDDLSVKKKYVWQQLKYAFNASRNSKREEYSHTRDIQKAGIKLLTNQSSRSQNLLQWVDILINVYKSAPESSQGKKALIEHFQQRNADIRPSIIYKEWVFDVNKVQKR